MGVRFNWNRTFFAGRIVLWFGLFMIIAKRVFMNYLNALVPYTLYEKNCGGILESLGEFI
ncbi:hypothetical protein D4758_05730 [Enterocloster citroniae]|nr:hypothetical protein [Enterocloster citroniae]